ncbi:MAG: response regulator transcription factor [Acidimicrobiales bacterium]
MRVMIVEDSVLLREGLGRILAEYGDEVVAALGSADGLVAAVEDNTPDVVIVDVRMPPTHTDEGLRAAIDLRRQRPGTPVLVLSQYVEERYASDLLSDDTEAVGYLLKERVADVADFVSALHRVAEGGTVLDPEVVAQLLARRRSGPLDSLTPREREVLALMAEGRSNAGIAQALVVSDGAVEKHISSIFGRLGLAPTDTEHRRVLAVLTWLRG